MKGKSKLNYDWKERKKYERAKRCRCCPVIFRPREHIQSPSGFPNHHIQNLKRIGKWSMGPYIVIISKLGKKNEESSKEKWEKKKQL